jgi:ABC-2 type transport system ATP-binding protein
VRSFDLLHDAQRRGATIFFSSHNLNEVDELCDRVALIRAGRLVTVERIASLRSHMQRRVMLRLRPDAHSDIAGRLAALPTISDLVKEQGAWRFAVNNLPPLLHLLSDLPIVDLTVEAPSLEEVFLRYYRVGERQ